ncbi:MAG: hypothetical protein IT200_05350 [Thermoleophilia bacterium]|nr:hypothetical protein [Thermoleophilia bacterium]
MSGPDDVFDRVRRSNPVDESRLAPRQAGAAARLRTRPQRIRAPWYGRVAGVATVTATFLVIGGLLAFAVPRGDAPDAGVPSLDGAGAPRTPLAPSPVSTGGSSTVEPEPAPPVAVTTPETTIAAEPEVIPDEVGAATGPRAPAPDPATSAPAPSSVPPSASDAAGIPGEFSVLRRPHTATDAPPKMVLDIARNADPARIRRARASDPPLFVVPNGKELCLVATPGGFACGPGGDVVPGPIVMSNLCVLRHPGHVEIVGLVPDEVRAVEVRTSTGESIPVTIANNVFALLIPKLPRADRIVFTLSSGRVMETGSGVPIDIGEEGC